MHDNFQDLVLSYYGDQIVNPNELTGLELESHTRHSMNTLCGSILSSTVLYKGL